MRSEWLSPAGEKLFLGAARDLLEDDTWCDEWLRFDSEFVAACIYPGHGGPAYDGRAAQRFLKAANHEAFRAGQRIYGLSVERNPRKDADRMFFVKLCNVYAGAEAHLSRRAGRTGSG